MTTVAQQGRLEERPLPQLLLELHGSRFGGALSLSRQRVSKRFLFQKGVPVFAESNLASESLGVQLMDAGKIDRSEYNRVVSHIEDTRCREGKALLDLGLLTPKELFVALKDQVRIRLVECFGWPNGEYHLDANAQTAEEAQPFRADLPALLQEGIEAHWNSERVLLELGPRMEQYPRPSRRFDAVNARLRVDDAVNAVREALDGNHTLWQVIQRATTPRSLAAAWVLDATGALDFARSARAGDTAPEVEIVVADARPAATARPAARPGQALPRPAADANLAKQLAQEIERKHELLEELSAYELLDVSSDAIPAVIRSAYLKAAKSYHPDVLARLGLPPELREQANRVFAAISKAHAVLSDPKRRQSYDATQGVHATDIDANRLAQAETLYRKAEILMRQGNFRGALEFLEPCVELWPDECAYQSALGWALYKKTPSEPERAREHLSRAERLDANDPENQFRLGIVLREFGESRSEAPGS